MVTHFVFTLVSIDSFFLLFFAMKLFSKMKTKNYFLHKISFTSSSSCSIFLQENKWEIEKSILFALDSIWSSWSAQKFREIPVPFAPRSVDKFVSKTKFDLIGLSFLLLNILISKWTQYLVASIHCSKVEMWQVLHEVWWKLFMWNWEMHWTLWVYCSFFFFHYFHFSFVIFIIAFEKR